MPRNKIAGSAQLLSRTRSASTIAQRMPRPTSPGHRNGLQINLRGDVGHRCLPSEDEALDLGKRNSRGSKNCRFACISHSAEKLGRYVWPSGFHIAPNKICTSQAAAGSRKNERADDTAPFAQAYLQMGCARAHQCGDNSRIGSHVVGENNDVAPPLLVVGSQALRWSDGRAANDEQWRRSQARGDGIGNWSAAYDSYYRGRNRIIDIVRAGEIAAFYQKARLGKFGQQGGHGVRRETDGACIPDHVSPRMNSVESSQELEQHVGVDPSWGSDHVRVLGMPAEPDSAVSLSKDSYREPRSPQMWCVHEA